VLLYGAIVLLCPGGVEISNEIDIIVIAPQGEKKTKNLFGRRHEMNHRCTICNHYYETLSYKDGHICEECLDSIRSLGVQDSDFNAW